MTDANQAVQEGHVDTLPAQKGVTNINPSWFERHPNEALGIFVTAGITAFAIIVSISGA